MAGCPDQLCIQMNNVLDAYGVSKTFTEFRRRMLYDSEIDLHTCMGDRMLAFWSGSKRDALCPISDTESDFDVVGVLPAILTTDTTVQRERCLSLFDSNLNEHLPVFRLERTSYPGYYYLKLLSSNPDSAYIKQIVMPCCTSFRGGTYISNVFKETSVSNTTDFEIHGPALQTVVNVNEILNSFDNVKAFHCSYLPTDYDEWFHRSRAQGWPPKHIIESTKNLGCLVVCVGHPFSETRPLEWRLSLNRTEYLLTKTFNHIQMKCYVMLRLVLKWLIQPKLKETLSSYHMKTVMFWMSEEKEKQFWGPANLAECFLHSLIKLRSFVVNKNCPNYFLTHANLLEGKLDDENVYHDTLRIIDDIIAEGAGVVYQCLPLNVHLTSPYCFHGNAEQYECLRHHLFAERVTEMIGALYDSIVTSNIKSDTYKLCRFGFVDWHVINEKYNDSILDSLTFSSISVCLEMGLPNKPLYTWHRKQIEKLRGNGHVARIKLATYFYYRRRLCYCIPLLWLVIKSLESSGEFQVCTQGQPCVKDIVKIEGVECIYLTQNKKGFRVSEIVFSPCDKRLIPPDLQDEMGRPKTVNGTHYEGWVFVDSIVYAYYLLIVTLHDMHRYSCISSLFRRFENVCTQQPGTIRIFRKDIAKRLYEHAYILVWAATKGFTKLSH
ncbi:uncharacterized protein [Argopecten irradians]|uniref:uncharacterized protein n=1 Tax=Argopecten irradians TaxID=31199 RepID=UPI003718715A